MAQLKNTLVTGNLTVTGTMTGSLAASNLTGQVSVANGGTGLSAVGTAGQVLMTNSGATAIEWASIVTTDEKVQVAADISTDADYPVVFAHSSTSTTTAETDTLNKASTQLYFNPSTGSLTATKVYNAVWNDYAEYRRTLPNVRPGQCVIDNDDGSLTISNVRLLPGAQIVSDTWGHIMGKTDNAQTPIAVAGRVLAYTTQPRENYHAGMAVCSGPDGTIDIMTREEIKEYPDCIIGYVSEIPNYETWGSGNVKVDNRIWIRVK